MFHGVNLRLHLVAGRFETVTFREQFVQLFASLIKRTLSSSFTDNRGNLGVLVIGGRTLQTLFQYWYFHFARLDLGVDRWPINDGVGLFG